MKESSVRGERLPGVVERRTGHVAGTPRGLLPAIARAGGLLARLRPRRMDRAGKAIAEEREIRSRHDVAFVDPAETDRIARARMRVRPCACGVDLHRDEALHLLERHRLGVV